MNLFIAAIYLTQISEEDWGGGLVGGGGTKNGSEPKNR